MLLGMLLGMLLVKQNELNKLLILRLKLFLLVDHLNPLLRLLVNIPLLVMGQLGK